jgi:transcriptional regulator with XRE-family HTH domain
VPTTISAELRRRRRELDVSQRMVADAVGVRRATVTQWEAGRFLPSVERLRRLDDFFNAGGELVGLLTAADRAAAGGFERTAGTVAHSSANRRELNPTRSLFNVLADVRRAIVEELCLDDDGRAIGWRHSLIGSDGPPSELSTCYALKALVLLGGPDAQNSAVVDWLLHRAVRSDGGRLIGWRSQVQRTPRLEGTAAAIDALQLAGVNIPIDEILTILGRLVDDTARARPFILTSALEPLLRLAPDAELARTLVAELMACRVDFGGVRLWSERRLLRHQSVLAPSVAHTARAVEVLRNFPDREVGDAVRSAEQWLGVADGLAEASEVIRRDLDEYSREAVVIDHFTATWVVRVLARAAVPDADRLNNALQFVWARYVPSLRLWAWGNGDVPVWMQTDAVAALQGAALALHATPILAEEPAPHPSSEGAG